MTCVDNAVKNYAAKRKMAFIDAEGDDKCVEADAAAKKVYHAAKWMPALWSKEHSVNFLVSFWWRPKPSKSFKDEGHTRTLLYKVR